MNDTSRRGLCLNKRAVSSRKQTRELLVGNSGFLSRLLSFLVDAGRVAQILFKQVPLRGDHGRVNDFPINGVNVPKCFWLLVFVHTFTLAEIAGVENFCDRNPHLSPLIGGGRAVPCRDFALYVQLLQMNKPTEAALLLERKIYAELE